MAQLKNCIPELGKNIKSEWLLVKREIHEYLLGGIQQTSPLTIHKAYYFGKAQPGQFSQLFIREVVLARREQAGFSLLKRYYFSMAITELRLISSSRAISDLFHPFL